MKPLNKMNRNNAERSALINCLQLYGNAQIRKEKIKAVLENEKIDLSDKTVSELLIYMVNTYSPEYRVSKNEVKYAWDYKEIIVALKEYKASLNWLEIFRNFDNDGLKIQSMSAFYLIIESWEAINGTNTFPYHLFLNKWTNERVQVDFLLYLIESNPAKTNIYINVFVTKILSVDDLKKLRNFEKEEEGVSGISPGQNYLPNNKHQLTIKTHESNFNCTELYKCINMLNSRMLIEKIAQLAPEWAFLGLPFVYPSFEDIFERLFFDLIKSERYLTLFSVLAKQNPTVLVENFSKALHMGIQLGKILDYVLELKLLTYVSEKIDPPFFCYEILILSSRRDHLNIHLWIGNAFNTKKDEFINSFIWYLIKKLRDAKSKCAHMNFKSTEQLNGFIKNLFPMTYEQFSSIVKTLDLLHPKFTKETCMIYNQLKETIPPELKCLAQRKLITEDHASEFITKIISQKTSIADGVILLKDMLKKGNLQEKEKGNKILLYLVENYNNFHRLNEWESMAIFYGKLIENNVFTSTYIKKAESNIIQSLKSYKENDQFYFSLRCLETFYGSIKKEDSTLLKEVEKIKGIKECLSGKEPQLQNEVYTAGLSIKNLLDEIFYETKAHNYFDNDTNNVESKIDKLKLDEVEKLNDIFNFLRKDNLNLSASKFNALNAFDTAFKLFIEYKIYDMRNYELYNNFFEVLSNNFKEYFLHKSFITLKNMVNYKIERRFERQFVSHLGSFLGFLTISQDQIFTLDTFDMKAFIVECIERKRLALCVHFVVNFLKEGRNSLIFRPKNPWVMRVFAYLTEIYDYNVELQDEILQLCKIFNITIETRCKFSEYGIDKKLYLTNYSVDVSDFILKHVICLAIDFSVKEICQAIIDRTCTIALKTVIHLFTNSYIGEENEKTYLKNALTNTAKLLTRVSAEAPIQTSLVGNISYFTKQANLEIDTSTIHRITNDNASKCLKLLERAAMTKLLDCFEDLYKNYIDTKLFTQSGKKQNTRKTIEDDKDNANELPLLTTSQYFERIEIKQIDPSEVVEVKNTLYNISKKVPNKKLTIINREWDNLVKVIDDERFFLEFERLITVIERSESKDALFENLCQCIVGYILKHETHQDMLFSLLSKIFSISFKTASNVVDWVIYGDDDRKMNISMVTGFIKYNLLNLAEFDQFISKQLKRTTKLSEQFEKMLQYVLGLLTKLVLGEIKICTPFDFVCTIETLSKMNEEKFEDRIYNVLRKFSEMVMPSEWYCEKNGIKYGSFEGMSVYEDTYNRKIMSHFLYYKEIEKKFEIKALEANLFENEPFNNHQSSLENFEMRVEFDKSSVKIKRLKYPLEEREFCLTMIGGIYLTWDSLIRSFRFPSFHSYSKLVHVIDCIATPQELYLTFKVMLQYFFKAFEKKNYLYIRFLAFFVTEIIKKLERTYIFGRTKAEYACFLTSELESDFVNVLIPALRVVSPMKVPHFTVAFLDIALQPYFIDRIITNEQAFFIFPEFLFMLNCNDKLIFQCTQFFSKVEKHHKTFFRSHSHYFSIICSNKFAFLKNMFNNEREFCFNQTNDSLNLDTYINTYHSMLNYLKGEVNEKILEKISELEESKKVWIMYVLIDTLAHRHKISLNALYLLRLMKKKNTLVEEMKEICLYRDLPNIPELLNVFIDECNFREINTINKF